MKKITRKLYNHTFFKKIVDFIKKKEYNSKLITRRRTKMFREVKDDKNEITLLKNKENFNVETEEQVIKRALNHPIQSEKLHKIVKPGETVVIVISDITRAFQKTGFYVTYIIEELKIGGIKEDDISFLCALGTHRQSSEEEFRILLGDLYGKYAIYDSCTETSTYKTLGTTSYGTVVEVNSRATEADHVILTGAIIHHDMAGFSGGRKSILPGICTESTINHNHALSMGVGEGTGIREHIECGSLKNNILHKDMVEAATMVNPSFLINVIQDAEGKIIEAVSGHWYEAHIAGCAIVDKINKIVVEEQKDVLWVYGGGYPKDINLYQMSKAMTHGNNALKEKGDFILIADCIERLGAPVMEYMYKNFKDNRAREVELRRAFTIGKYAAYLTTVVAARVEVTIVSKYLTESDVENTGIKVVRSIDEVKKQLENKYPKGYSGYYTEAVSSLLEYKKQGE